MYGSENFNEIRRNGSKVGQSGGERRGKSIEEKGEGELDGSIAT